MQVYLEVPNSEKIAQAVHSKVKHLTFQPLYLVFYYKLIFLLYNRRLHDFFVVRTDGIV